MKIVVIDALGLHTGFLGCYGNDDVATPMLDSLACDGIVFDNHLADYPVLMGEKISSARTGRFGFSSLPCQTDLLDHFRRHDWQVDLVRPRSLPTFGPDIIPVLEGWQADRSALLWVDGPSLAPPWSLTEEQLAAYFDDEKEARPWPAPPQSTRKLLSLEDWKRLRSTYAAVVSWFDVRLEELGHALVERGWGEDLLLCITARAGLPLGEHGLIGDGPGPLHAERVQLPLILRLPDEQYAGYRIAGLTQPVDLLPSLAEFLFQEKVQGDGKSFWPLVREEVEEIRTFAVAALGAPSQREAYFRTRDWALAATAGTEGSGRNSQLFLKPEDRWEVNDMSLKHLEKTEELEGQLRAVLKEIP